MACSLRSEKEAKHYLKITLARRKTRTEAARASFPGDTSFTQGDSGWPMTNSYPFHKDISLSASFISPSLQIPPFLITTPSSHLWGAAQTSSFGTANPPRLEAALGPGGRAALPVTRRSWVLAARARLQTLPCRACVLLMSRWTKAPTMCKLFIRLLNLRPQSLWKNSIHTKFK